MTTLQTFKAIAEYSLEAASGPNPEGKRYQLVDANGDRVAYCNGPSGARNAIRDLHPLADRVTTGKNWRAYNDN